MVKISTSPGPIKPKLYILEDVQYLNSDSAHWRLTVRSHVWRPPTDVFETEDVVVVRVEIAGMRESDFSVALDGRYLSIRGTRPDISERRAYHQMEIRFGEFSTDVELSCPVEMDKIEAVYNNGFLRVILPKALPHKIQIEE